jgi:hypothetical protein
MWEPGWGCALTDFDLKIETFETVMINGTILVTFPFPVILIPCIREFSIFHCQGIPNFCALACMRMRMSRRGISSSIRFIVNKTEKKNISASAY